MGEGSNLLVENEEGGSSDVIALRGGGAGAGANFSRGGARKSGVKNDGKFPDFRRK